MDAFVESRDRMRAERSAQIDAWSAATLRSRVKFVLGMTLRRREHAT